MTKSQAESSPAGWQKWGIMFVLALALAIIVIDTTLLNVSLSTIIREFNTTIQSMQWVITAYSLTLAALTVTGGRLGDFFGRKRMFMVGAIIFAIGSFIASISNGVPMMIVGESIVEGIGAALMMPATSSLLVANFQGRERAIAFGIWGGVAAASSALGPILGGWLTTHYSWRWGFRINVVVAALLLIGSIIIKESHDTQEKPDLDWLGVVLSAIGLLLIVFGFIEASTYGWWLAKADFVIGSYTFPAIAGLSIAPIAIILGLVIMALFFMWQRQVENRGRTPLVSLEIFKIRQFTTGSLTTAVMSLGMTGLVFVLPVFLQAVRQLDAFNTGIALLPMSIAILIAAPLSGFLSSKIGPKTLILAGLLANVVGGIIMRQTFGPDTTVAQLIPGLLVYGVGMGMVMAQISNLTLSAVSVQQAGEASGINNTIRQVGSTLGSAIIGAVMLTAVSNNLTTGIQNSTVIPSQAKPAIVEVVSSQTSNVEFGGGAQVNGQIPPVIANEITKISHRAISDGAKASMTYAAIFSFLGFLVALSIPKIDPKDHGHSAAAQPAAGH